jgi:hypothetical protein
MKTKKPSAADRTISIFAAPAEPTIEVLEEEEKGERVPLEEDTNRLRNNAFLAQEWTTKAFGEPDAEGNEYRVSHKGSHYYLETLHKLPGGKTAHGYSGLMVHERDLYAVVTVLVQAVREKQKNEQR